MREKLQKKTIVAYGLLVGLVLIAAAGVQAAGSFRQVRELGDAALQSALRHDERAPTRWETGVDEEQAENGLAVGIPTVCVELNQAGTISSVWKNEVEVSRTVLQAAVAAALADGADSGVIADPDLRYCVERGTDGTAERIAFADRAWERGFLSQRLLVAAVLFPVAFVAILLIGLNVFRPVRKQGRTSRAQQKEFMADATKELKVPLAVMRANAKILITHPTETVGSMREWVDHIQDECDRMEQLVEDVLFLVRSDTADEGERPRSRVALSDVVWSRLLPFQAVALERGITLEGDVESGVTLLGNREQLQRLVVILLDNACKHAGQDGTIKLSLTRRNEGVVLAVHNTGEPLSAEERSHLFERFYRPETSSEWEDGGYDLGLAIAQSIVEGHGGHIDVISTVSEGTVFKVVLPED